jgi:nucleoside-diphosphate-sugar epimerase
MKPTILLTGATGFVGLRYVEYNKDIYNIRPLSLQKTKVADVDFSNIDAIVHLAGMAHQMQKIDPQIYFDVNFDLTKALAIEAKAAGVKHFIFVSTIKVFGEHHTTVLNEKSPCEPINDPYGQSKLDAEEFLKTLEDDNFTVAIVRPPLIYGPNVKGNLIRFLKLADTNYPLPFKGIDNRRTMVFLDNLIALLNTIVDKKSSGLFLASDAQPISTTYLISEMRRQMGKSPNLFTIPSLFTSILSKVKPEFALRLYGSLEMDATESNKKINFTPPYSIEQGIKTMVQWYKTTA